MFSIIIQRINFYTKNTESVLPSPFTHICTDRIVCLTFIRKVCLFILSLFYIVFFCRFLQMKRCLIFRTFINQTNNDTLKLIILIGFYYFILNYSNVCYFKVLCYSWRILIYDVPVYFCV